MDMTQKTINVSGAIAASVAIVVAGMWVSSPRVKANDVGNDQESKIQQGFAIAPVPLNLVGKNPALVGMGSYIVNTHADCDGCHYSPDLGGEFVVPTGMPYFLKPPKISNKINPAGYLGGGRDFGQYPSVMPVGAFPHIFSRNLTPDASGRPDPVKDVEVISEELASFGAHLEDKPVIMVASKIDVANKEKLTQLKRYCKKNDLELFPVSAVTGKGIDDLKYAIAEKVEELRLQPTEAPAN